MKRFAADGWYNADPTTDESGDGQAGEAAHCDRLLPSPA